MPSLAAGPNLAAAPDDVVICSLQQCLRTNELNTGGSHMLWELVAQLSCLPMLTAHFSHYGSTSDQCLAGCRAMEMMSSYAACSSTCVPMSSALAAATSCGRQSHKWLGCRSLGGWTSGPTTAASLWCLPRYKAVRSQCHRSIVCIMPT